MSDLNRYAVGREAVLVVGIRGVVEALDDNEIVVAGTAWPRRLNPERGIRYLSMEWPTAPDCERNHCGPECDAMSPAHEDVLAELNDLIEVIREWHYEDHDMAFRICDHVVCRRAQA